MSSTDHLTIITADSHAGGSHEQYREYLDSQYVDDFDAWRGKYKNPFKDLKDDRRTRATGTATSAGRSRTVTASSPR